MRRDSTSGFAGLIDRPGTNGNGRHADGIPDRNPADVEREHARDIERREREEAARLASRQHGAEPDDDDTGDVPEDGLKLFPPKPAPPTTPPPPPPAATSTPATGERLLTCDEKPGEFFTRDQAAALAGVKPDRLYNAVYRRMKCSGLMFRPAPGHESKWPQGSEKKRSHKAKGSKSARPAASEQAAKPAPKKAPHLVEPGPAFIGENLTALETARVVVALGNGAPVEEITAALTWAMDAAARNARLRAIIDGRAAVEFDPAGHVVVNPK